MPPHVRLLLFATAREAVGRPSLAVSIPPGGTTVGRLVRGLASAYPSLGRVLRVSRVVVNGEYAARTARVRPGDEVAVHPPYSGG